MPERGDDITRVLRGFDQNSAAAGELLELVYAELKAIAQRRMSREDPGHSLQATALVHDAFARVLGDGDQSWSDRGHFFRAAAEAMRRILIDHARKKKSTKRGGGRRKAAIDVLDLATDYDAEGLIELDEALTILKTEDPSAAEVVHLRFFGGLDVSEIAATMEVSERSVAREWAFAKARLFSLLSPEAGEAS
ncbi:MAG: ECF-type sigma factor [Planctomycetota bacterium]